MPAKIHAEVLYNRCIAQNIYQMGVERSEYQGEILPGQFAHIQLPQSEERILKRPISFHAYDGHTAEFIYQVTGEGTRRLSEVKSGEFLTMLLPLGNGFPMKEEYQRILVIGGGVGISPLRPVVQMRECDAILGYKSLASAYQVEFYQNACTKTLIATEDGTLGQKGFVTDLLGELELSVYDAIFICGPAPMLRALKPMLAGINDVYVSMEERMGCGMGGCAVCACQVEQEGKTTYKKTCLDGPVFPLAEVVL